MNISKSLKLLMEEHDVSGKRLARDLGVTQQTVVNYRTNKYQHGKVVEQLAQYFGMSVSEFIKVGE